ncbi:long-chain acyl-CoA synthetase [Dysgonomonas sp. PFB1-18]|uniref:AMP-binding protein n=1 Tax=unclassified Dysgonomonas TaxID=2630389 RepID=UPI002473D29A|nr:MULTISPECIES: AMP-binding protein [unclassified Dysgonomonas]MDH6308658.1 long-chain acyl-CoA synthetase [Dysgonomonas sp. PF1-14]MDH6338159.1 long-chain acyl-CoA synthetase [Dysgonomonas sp. PF1-16]MDH6379656.1 long-chain acyl-CoA synthetase [Dysgonomonas sp. PFB1-18]MDH6396986.1 long-chain acyl-CoA synthetase [Dysgonomonas sp. PF1-23]
MENNKFLALIKDGILENWERPALTDYNGETYLYKDFARKIAQLHILLNDMEVKQGDKIAICGRNSANWAVAFFASLNYGAVITTLLHDFSGESIHTLVNHSEARVLFVDEYVWSKIDPVEVPAVETIMMIDDFSVQKSRSAKLLASCADLEQAFKLKYPNGFGKEHVKVYDESPEELAVLNYTSGTTSNPKGVMIPYRSLWSNTRFAIDMIPFVKAGDGIVCMLPMAHMYGLAFEVLLSIAKGCHIHYLTRVPSPQIIMDAFAKVNPTLVLAVPLIIEKIVQTRVFPEFKKQPVKTLLNIPFFRKKIYKKVADKLIPVFGNKLVEVVIGGAALNKEVGTFLSDIRFPYTVGYGMTECGPLISYEFWDTYKAGSCGRPVDRMEVRIDSSDPEREAGEIITKGDNVMLGYYKNPEATKATFTEDGWLKTGDLGIIDKDNFVFIKGRSKTMILSGSGQNIYPEEIEDFFNNSPYVAESLIIEENGKLIALIYPDHDYMKKHDIKEDDYSAIFVAEMKAINKRLPKYSQVVNFRLQDQEFEKTPKRSIKRFLYQK